MTTLQKKKRLIQSAPLNITLSSSPSMPSASSSSFVSPEDDDDPVSHLRLLHFEGRMDEVTEDADGNIVFAGGKVWPGHTITGFRVNTNSYTSSMPNSSSTAASPERSYPLRSVFHLLRGLSAIRREDRRDLIHFFEASASPFPESSSASLPRPAKRPRLDLAASPPRLVQWWEREEEEDRIQSLPDELLLRILSHVPLTDVATRVSLVSRKFGDLARDASLWTSGHLVLCTGAHFAAAESILRSPPAAGLRRLTLSLRRAASEVTGSTESVASLAAELCPRLEELRVGLERSHDLRRILRATGDAPNLRTLHLWGDWDAAVLAAAAADGLRRIARLRIVTDEGLDDAALRALGSGCRQLRTFHSFRVRHPVGDDALLHFVDGVGDTLTDLAVDGTQLTDAAYAKMDRGTKLERLSVQNAREMRGPGLASICRLAHLRKLQLSFYFWTDGGINLSGDDVVKAFSAGRTLNLVTLALDGCLGLDDEGLAKIAEKCPNLTELTLNASGKTVSDAGVTAVFRGCGALRALQLCRVAGGVTRKAFENAPDTLRVLTVDSSRECIAKEELRAIAKMMPALAIRDYGKKT